MQYLKGLLWLVFSCLIFSGCVPLEEQLRYKPGSAEPVFIGLVLPLSGPDSEYGERMLNGALLGAEMLNSGRGHFGRRVEVMAFDSGSSAEGAAAAFEKAVNVGAIGIVGGYSTVEAGGMTSLAAKLRVPLVIPMATGNDTVINPNPFVCRAVFTDRQQSEMIAGYLKYYRRTKRLAVTAAAEPEALYSRNVAGEVTAAFKKLGGGTVVLREIKKEQAEKVLREITDWMPDAVLLPFEGKTAAHYYKLLRRFGYQGLICGPDSWDERAFFQELEGLKNPGNSFYTGFFNHEATHTEFENFRKNFRKKFYYQPESCEIQTYDALNLLLTGFGNNADTLKKFQKNWRSMRKYTGAAAVYTMGRSNEIDRTIYINRVGKASFDKNKFEPKNIIGLQYSRLKVYAVDED